MISKIIWQPQWPVTFFQQSYCPTGWKEEAAWISHIGLRPRRMFILLVRAFKFSPAFSLQLADLVPTVLLSVAGQFHFGQNNNNKIKGDVLRDKWDTPHILHSISLRTPWFSKLPRGKYMDKRPSMSLDIALHGDEEIRISIFEWQVSI